MAYITTGVDTLLTKCHKIHESLSKHKEGGGTSATMSGTSERSDSETDYRYTIYNILWNLKEDSLSLYCINHKDILLC